jgi:hypothetical protein
MDAEQKAGVEFFTGPFLSASGVENCVGCHSLPAGTNRLVNFEHTRVGRDMKTAHLRNVYDKIGRFSAPGPQISGFGLIHDGSFDTVVNFLGMDGFDFPGKNEDEKDVVRRQLHQYSMAFDTGMAPAVGRQLTVAGELRADDREMLHLLEIRSAAAECDLTARGWEGKAQRGWLYRDYAYQRDRRGERPSTAVFSAGSSLSKTSGSQPEPLGMRSPQTATTIESVASSLPLHSPRCRAIG